MRRWTGLGLALVLMGCGGGGSASADPYDATYDCEQTIQCAVDRNPQEDPPGTLDECVSSSEAALDELTTGQLMELGMFFEMCQDATSCEYVDCLTALTASTETGLRGLSRVAKR